MKKFAAGCVAFGVLFAAQCAGAADLSVAPLYTKAPPAPTAPAYNWSGFYLGVNGGGGWGHSNWDTSATRVGTSGGLAGGTAGYNYQFNNNVVLGVEGDIDWAHINGTNTSAGCVAGCTTGDTWLSTVRGRLGYAFGGIMPYVTGGLAVGDIKASTPGFPGASATNTGWTAGGGVEFALPGTSNWTAKAEYLHVDLGRFNCGVNCNGTPTDNVSAHNDIVRAGVNYRFGWGQ
jgi:outer membrane immunogenic protein